MIPARHLMDPWRDALITELRLRDLPGTRIGEVLAEVDAHCTDSGQTPAEAFGDPVTYAQSLILIHAPAAAPADSGRRLVRSTARAFATLAGVLGLLDAVDGLVGHGLAEVTAGQLTSVVLGTAVFPLVVAALFHSGLARRRGTRAGIVAVSFLAPTLPTVLWSTPVAHVSAGVLLAASLFLLAAAWWPNASDRILADRIIDPRTGAEPFATRRLLLAAIRWMLPTVLLIAVALIIWFS
jgi:hypothetical protein